ncbi:hypothetical protein M5K25_006962 [Dendrobium thyrsiflorum]|uniref:Uncharacterized protein n=1 Tax=Dendrobium thyrsiflorum TaxID=117978 RepID=A0ABD0VJN0_DENTH
MAAKKVDALEERLEGEMNQIKTTVEERMSSMEGQVADLRDMIKKMLEVHNQITASVARNGEGRSTNSEIRREEEEAEINWGRDVPAAVGFRFSGSLGIACSASGFPVAFLLPARFLCLGYSNENLTIRNVRVLERCNRRPDDQEREAKNLSNWTAIEKRVVCIRVAGMIRKKNSQSIRLRGLVLGENF